jgi:hypothetical protein
MSKKKSSKDLSTKALDYIIRKNDVGKGRERKIVQCFGESMSVQSVRESMFLL